MFCLCVFLVRPGSPHVNHFPSRDPPSTTIINRVPRPGPGSVGLPSNSPLPTLYPSRTYSPSVPPRQDVITVDGPSQERPSGPCTEVPGLFGDCHRRGREPSFGSVFTGCGTGGWSGVTGRAVGPSPPVSSSVPSPLSTVGPGGGYRGPRRSGTDRERKG